MRAAVLRGLNEPLALEDVDVDEPGPQEVLIRTAAAGVCHSDLSVADGTIPRPLPLVLGHESAGVVERVGSLVTYVQPGDHVVTCPSVFCGHCEYCLTGRPALCPKEGVVRPSTGVPRLSQDRRPLPQFAEIGSFAEQLLVHENALVKIPQEMPLDRAALLGCGVTTGLGAVFNTARVPPGATVVVIGCGGVGLSAIQGARIAGALRIVADVLFEGRRELARQLGATDVVDPAAGDPVEHVVELTRGGVDHAFEAVGRKETVAQAFAMVRPGGTATVIGAVIGETLEIDGTLLLADRRIQGSLMGSNRFRIDIPRYVELYVQGRLSLDEVVTARYPLEEINEAMSAAATGEGARTVIIFDGTKALA
jgi:S-(hydroxymethyl)glutathione dehydrogenase/alcohol dehydrogenase